MPVLDPFGRREIYPTNTHPNRAKPWFYGIGDWQDREYTAVDYYWEHYSTVGSGNNLAIHFLYTDSPYWGRFVISALQPSAYVMEFELDQSKLTKRGFMATKNDWKNVEMTLYFRFQDAAPSNVENWWPALAFSVRGGPHHKPPNHCYGSCLYVGLDNWGVPHIYKELFHDNGYSVVDWKAESISNDQEFRSRWIGMKGVFYNKANGNPYIEVWLDKYVHNNWERIPFNVDGRSIEGYEDAGGWIAGHKDCGGEIDEKITWGGPFAIFKLNYLTDVYLQHASVREILPPEGWPIRHLLNARGLSPPFSMRSLAQEYGLTAPISLRQLTELEAERDRG